MVYMVKSFETKEHFTLLIETWWRMSFIWYWTSAPVVTTVQCTTLGVWTWISLGGFYFFFMLPDLYTLHVNDVIFNINGLMKSWFRRLRSYVHMKNRKAFLLMYPRRTPLLPLSWGKREQKHFEMLLIIGFHGVSNRYFCFPLPGLLNFTDNRRPVIETTNLKCWINSLIFLHYPATVVLSLENCFTLYKAEIDIITAEWKPQALTEYLWGL